MERISLAIITILASVCMVTAQDLSMLSGDPQWTYGWYSNNEFKFTEPIAMIKDENGMLEKDGRIYHQLFQVEQVDALGSTIFIPYDPIGAREEDGKVYILYEDYQKAIASLQSLNRLKDVPIPYLQTSENELLFYDFTLQAGDKYPTSAAYEDIYVEKVDTVVTEDAKFRKLFTLTNGLQILEGIGCLNSQVEQFGFALLYYLYPPDAWVNNNKPDFIRLYEYKNNDKIIYKEHAVPTNVNSTLNSKPSSLNLWTDLSGRPLTTPPTHKGIYIKDGKKVMVK